MARGDRKLRSPRKPKNKNVLVTRSPNNSRGSRNSRNSRSSIWSKSSGNVRKPRSPKQIILMIIILIAFICGLALGLSMIMGPGDSNEPAPGEVQYMNVTNNISEYENSSYDLTDENGTQISYYDFKENVTEGQNVTAFNASSSANIY